jgi:hypothetical protein
MSGFQPALSSIRFIPFQAFQTHERIPRYPEENLTLTLEEITERNLRESSFFIFVSHRWLRANEPDDEDQSKYQLCCFGIRRIMATYTLGFENCFLWLDYGCVNQTNDPASELRHLDVIIRYCDILFTPIVDPPTFVMPRMIRNWYTDFASPQWEDYLNRAWCRIEMFYGTHLDLWDSSAERLDKFKKGLKEILIGGRRGHFLFPQSRTFPFVLYPFQDYYLEQFRPSEGALTNRHDQRLIEDLENSVQVRSSRSSYVGGTLHGQKHGKGILVDRTGDKFVGNWVHDYFEGQGTQFCPDGNSDSGEWKRGSLNGFGTRTFMDGSSYTGHFRNGMKHGHGTFRWFGDINGTYTGQWVDNKKSGRGMWTSDFDGSVYEGEYLNDVPHGAGTMYIDGQVFEVTNANGVELTRTLIHQ